MTNDQTTSFEDGTVAIDYEAVTGARLHRAAKTLSGAASDCATEIRLRVWEQELAAFRAAQPLDGGPAGRRRRARGAAHERNGGKPMTGTVVRPIQFDELQIDDEIRFDGLAGAGADRLIARKAHAALVEARDVYSTARVLVLVPGAAVTHVRQTDVSAVWLPVPHPRDTDRRSNHRPTWLRQQPNNLTGRPPLAG